VLGPIQTLFLAAIKPDLLADRHNKHLTYITWRDTVVLYAHVSLTCDVL